MKPDRCSFCKGNLYEANTEFVAKVGGGEPCFIIAEAGSNHNGSLEQAKDLIDVAADAKADALKV